MPGIHATIFDLDGTLIDSLDDITDALNSGLQHVGSRLVDRENVRVWIGDGLANLCRRALPDDDEQRLEALMREMRITYFHHCADRTAPYPNILKTLELLKRAGVPACVLSNKPHELTVEIVKRLGINSWFHQVRGCIDDEHRKPSPVVAMELAETMDTLPAHTLIVGDGPADILCAQHAGMKSAAVAWGFREPLELERIGPDFFLNDPLEIFDVIG